MFKEKKKVLKQFERIYHDIDPLPCLHSMVEYYQCIYKSINHLVGHRKFKNESNLSIMSFDQVREFRRYINSDLENLSIEFYLQRAGWALECGKNRSQDEHRQSVLKYPARHPCLMKAGFKKITDEGEKGYTYENFLGETLPIFVAIHNHLVSINRALGDLYYYVTEAPFSSFTPTGKSEIRNLTSQLNRIMRGLLVATHLQPQYLSQGDLVSYMVSCRADCQQFFEIIPRYYQTHRMRLVVFPVDRILPDNDPYQTRQAHTLPLTCMPWSAGVYLDFLAAYESIALHTMAVLVWAIRLYSLWFFVPRRYLRLIAPLGTTGGRI